MDLGLVGRAYIVTGASGGLGLASARALAADGARVVIASRDRERIDAAAASLVDDGISQENVVAAVADLGDAAAPQQLVRQAHEAFGRLDGAVVSVGGPPAGGVMDATDDQWRTAFDSVFLGGIRLARAVLAQDHTQDAQVAVTLVLSSSVKTPIPGLGISNGLRPGLAMAAKTLADETGPGGGRVNVLLPGRFDTDRVRHLDGLAEDPEAARAASETTIPLRRYGTPDEFGRVAAFVTSPAASYLSGVALAVDGGATRAL